VADPLAGSWFIEDLTSRMEKAAEDYFAAIDERGGIVKAIADGYPQREIAEAAFHYQSQLDSGERVIVGVNAFQETVDGRAPEVLVIDIDVESDQAERLRQLREKRDNTSVATRLDALKEVAAGTENTMPAIIDAVRARATEGEIVSALREVFGVYHETPVF
jgi:methylmalonyl-CoA mutase N-terminal domain/subunit